MADRPLVEAEAEPHGEFRDDFADGAEPHYADAAAGEALTVKSKAAKPGLSSPKAPEHLPASLSKTS